MAFFAELTSPQIADFIARKSLVLIPVGQVEEHGPHLPVNADAVVAQRVTHAAAEKLADLPCVVLPTVWAGYSGRELQNWPGTIRLRTRVFADMMFDIISSLVEMGFDKIATVNGHGHHPALLEMTAREIADAHSVYIACIEVAKMAAEEVARCRRSAPGGCIHGGEYETSLMLHFGCPVDMAAAHGDDMFAYSSANVPADGFTGGKKAFWSTWGIQRSKTGIYGDPTCACAETGERIFNAAVDAMVDFCREYHAHPAADWRS